MKNHKYAIFRIILAVLLVAGTFGVQSVHAETIDFGWAQSIGGTELDYGTAVALDGSGNVYVTGFVLTTPRNQDAFIYKWDANGNFIWSRFFAGSSSEGSHAVALDVDGNVYVSGVFSATVEFDPGNSAGTLTSAGLADAFLVKFDSDGNFIWVKSVGGTSSEEGNGLAVDHNGDVYMIGSYSGTSDFDPSEGISNLTSAGSSDVFVIKFDSNGNFIWAKSMGGQSHDNAFDIAVNGTGDIFFTGYFGDTADFDPGLETTNLISAGQGDIFIGKLDSNGNFVWARGMGGSGHDTGTEITLDGDGNVVVTGFTSNAETHDILIDKWDGNGNLIWTKGIGGTDWNGGYGIAVDGNDNIYITGDFSGTVDFDPGTGTSSLTSAGAGDIFVDKLDSDGNFIWANRLGGTSGDVGEGIILDGNDDLYLMGSYQDTVDFDLGAGTSNLTSAGSSDIFISKLNIIPQIHYVKWNATGANDGSSWEDGYTDLQSALSAASSGDEIWVAAGTYIPGNDRHSTFALKDGVAVYGGFAGTETSREQRNPLTHVTILSGDLNGDDNGNVDVSEPTRAENVFHVVSSSGAGSATVLDGFTITGGNAYGGGYGGPDPEIKGGGLWNVYGNPTLANLIFRDNTGTHGGGMYSSGDVDSPSAPSLTNVVFHNNLASAGGGMYNSIGSDPLLMNVTFSDNSSWGGGGMYIEESSPKLRNVTFSGNSAPSGGGIYNNYGGSPSLINVTIKDNSATHSASSGGAIFNNGSNITIYNSILHGNTGGEIRNNTGVTNVSYSIVQGGYTGTGNIDQDPLLGPLQDNGGFTQTMALGAGSPAIDAADDTNCPATDQRGVARPQGTHCDMGAFEASPSLVVTKLDDTNDGVCDSDCSLREAIEDALPGDTITFGPALAGGGIGLSSQLLITKDLTIDGSGLNPPLFITTGFTARIMEINYPAKVTISGLILESGHASSGYGGAVYSRGEFTAINSTFSNNSAVDGGAIWGERVKVINSIFSSNTAGRDGGAINGVLLDIRNSTFHRNEAFQNGGAISNYGDGSVTIANSTIFQNKAGNSGGGTFMTGYPLVSILNSTFAENTAAVGHEFAFGQTYQVVFGNTIFVCNVPGEDCYVPAGNTITNTNSILGIGTLHDYGLADLANNGGPTETMALFPESPLIDAGDDTICTNAPVDTLDQRGVARPQGNHCDIGAYEYDGTDSTVKVFIGTTEMDSYPLGPNESLRKSYPGKNGGPVKISNTGGFPITAAERVIYKVNGLDTSFTELMGLPANQVDKVYWLPWYNSKTLDTQLRIANVSKADANVHVRIGGTDVTGSPFTIPVGGSVRKTFSNIDKGPVLIESDQDIVAAERVIYKVNNINTSFTEMMALPAGQVDQVYWLPWYNSKTLDTQLRIANVSNAEAEVHVTIGGMEVTGSPFTIPAGASVRKTFPNIDKGPVKIESDVDIVAAERVIYKVNNINTSFTEMMAMPASQVDTTYWLPWYNSKTLDTQLRIANVGNADTTVHVTIGGTEVLGSPFTIPAGGSVRKAFPNIDRGPVKIVSDPGGSRIVAAERVIYKVSGVDVSFSEMMALPASLLDTLYWLPWYNNKELDTQLRFGVP